MFSKARDDGDLCQVVSSGDDEKWWDSGCILEV